MTPDPIPAEKKNAVPDAQLKRLRQGKCPRRYGGRRCTGKITAKTDSRSQEFLVCIGCGASWRIVPQENIGQSEK